MTSWIEIGSSGMSGAFIDTKRFMPPAAGKHAWSTYTISE
jgi:hypothetical protein